MGEWTYRGKSFIAYRCDRDMKRKINTSFKTKWQTTKKCTTFFADFEVGKLVSKSLRNWLSSWDEVMMCFSAIAFIIKNIIRKRGENKIHSIFTRNVHKTFQSKGSKPKCSLQNTVDMQESLCKLVQWLFHVAT